MAPELLGEDREVGERRLPAQREVGDAEAGEVAPQVRVEAERLRGADTRRRRLLGEERAERVAQGRLVVGERGGDRHPGHSTCAWIDAPFGSIQPFDAANASMPSNSSAQPGPTRPAAIRRTASTVIHAW